MAHGLGLLDTWESARFIDEILAEAATDGVSQNQWLTRQQRRDKVGELDGLRQAVAVGVETSRERVLGN